jgi:hypothetical protein
MLKSWGGVGTSLCASDSSSPSRSGSATITRYGFSQASSCDLTR